jgi:DNA polymerase
MSLTAIKKLAKEYESCKRCSLLQETRSSVVFGGGNVKASVVIVGEAPGADEDRAVVPFVGKAGRLLMQLLLMSWPPNEVLDELDKLPTSEDDEFFERLRDFLDNHLFWTNTTCCWPGEGNRQPTPKEIKECRDRLVRTIYEIDPLLIIAAGAIPASALVGRKVAITDKRGMLFDITIKSPVTGADIRYPMFAILHPSFLLRQGDSTLMGKKMGWTYKTVEDLKYIFSILDEEYQCIYNEKFPYRPKEKKRK